MRIAGELDEGNVVFIVADDGWKYLSSGIYTRPVGRDRESGLHRLVVNTAPRATRRGLLGASGATLLAAGGAVSGCGRTSRRPKVHRIPPVARAEDIHTLNGALDLTNEAIAAYTAGIPLLAGTAHSAAKHFLDQELSHAGELFGLVKQAGGKPVKPAAEL